jgi:hypothetical protein
MKRYLQPTHRFAPKMWRQTHNITGDAVFDASIEHCKNKTVPGKVSIHCATDNAYGYRTSYRSYSGLSGDD